MVEPQPRKYLTRSRAKAYPAIDAPTTGLSAGPRRAPSKRKALAEATSSSNEALSDENNDAPKPMRTRSGRPTKRQSLSPPPESALNAIKAPPARKERTAEAAKKTVGKKVTFVSPQGGANGADKENASPEEQKNEVVEVVPTTTGPLSTKPKRMPKSKLKQPSGSLEAPLSALSPLKARRPARPANREEDMEDELSAVNSPRLAVKPIRPAKAALAKEKDSKQRNPMETSSALFGSPAKRPANSPFKKISKFGADQRPLDASPAKSALKSPAKRPLGGNKVASKHTPRKYVGSSLKHSIEIELTDEDPFLDEKNLDLDDDLSEDELNSPAKPVGRQLFLKNPPVLQKREREDKEDDENVFFVDLPAQHYQQEMDYEDMDRKIAALNTPIVGVPSPVRSTTPPLSPLAEAMDISPCKASPSESRAERPVSPTPTRKHRSPSMGGSSYGLLGSDSETDEEMDENDENSPPPPSCNLTPLASKLSDIDLSRSPRRSFGQELSPLPSAELAQPFYDLDCPVDPMLLLGADNDSDDIVVDYAEVSTHTSIPAKLPTSSSSSSDEECDAENSQPRHAPAVKQSPPHSIKPTRRRRSSAIGPIISVLAGAVVFCDIHLADGADASASFEHLLRGLGARVLKSWPWNPADAHSRVGITHVVFKDGSPATLRKMQAARGLVSGVGLGWVVACAEQQAWVDEAVFEVDMEVAPRGGGRKRKSMEPKAYEAMIGELMAPPKKEENAMIVHPPKTPSKQDRRMPTQMLRTAPPKLVVDPALQAKLMSARKRSMMHAPKVGSPLAKQWRLGEWS